MQRFWAKVDKSGECWLWTARKDRDGYGRIRYAGNDRNAARVVWMITRSSIPEDFQVLHRCDNPACVRPKHLWLGTSQQNMEDRDRKGRGILGETHHQAKLTEDDVRAIRASYPELTYQKLADDYGVSPSQISHVVKRIHWKLT